MTSTTKRRGFLVACSAALLLTVAVLANSNHSFVRSDDGQQISSEKNLLLTGKGKGHGYGPGNGTGNGGSGPKDGSGYGPGSCSTKAFTIDPELLFAGRGKGKGNGAGSGRKGPGDGTGTCINS